MLTRIEVDGFKNLLGFSAEFGLFNCIAGPNAVGKSNLFDAIEFLSLLADYPLEEAARRVRKTPGSHESSRTLFWTNGQVHSERIRICVEFIADGWVSDELGRGARPANPTLRYEVELRHDGQLRLAAERLLVLGSSSQRPSFPHHSSFLRAHRITDGDRPERVLYDAVEGPMPGSGGTPNLGLAREVILRSYGTAEHVEILATLEEMRTWQRLTLDPVELRKPHVDTSARRLGPNGEHLPMLLERLTNPGYPHMGFEDEADEREAQAYFSAMIVARMRPVASLREIKTDYDQERQTLTLYAKTGSGEAVSARSLSEGTLRFLALVMLVLDSGDRLLCIEEPENGIHPRKISELAETLYELSTDAERDIDRELAELDDQGSVPLRQVIINTHSSDLVKQIFGRHKADLLMATTALTRGPNDSDARILRLNPLRGTWRCRPGVRGVMLPVIDYVGAAVVANATASAAEDS